MTLIDFTLFCSSLPLPAILFLTSTAICHSSVCFLCRCGCWMGVQMCMPAYSGNTLRLFALGLQVHSSSAEFKRVQSRVHQTLASANIVSLQRAQYTYLWKKYYQVRVFSWTCAWCYSLYACLSVCLYYVYVCCMSVCLYLSMRCICLSVCVCLFLCLTVCLSVSLIAFSLYLHVCIVSVRLSVCPPFLDKIEPHTVFQRNAFSCMISPCWASRAYRSISTRFVF